ARKSVCRRRELLEVARQRAGQIWECRCRFIEQILDRARILRAEGLPGAARQVELLRLHQRTVGLELFELRRGKRWDVTIDNYYRKFLPTGGATSEEVEQLDELELVVEIVLEPEHNLVEIIEALDDAIPLLKISADVRKIVPVVTGDELRALLAELFQRERRIDGSFVKHVAPGDDLSFDAGFAHGAGGAIAIRDVEPLRGQRQRVTGRYVDLS